MSMHTLKASAFALAVATVGLAACDQQPFRKTQPPPAAALPLTDVATGPLPIAPPAQALPAAPRPRIARLREPRTHYAYLDRGYELSDVFYDAPPDYAFDYGGVEPWVWRSDEGYYLVAEPLDYGWRYYYYEPDVYYPFLVRDPYYSYGFDRGALVVVYDRGGRVLDPVFVDRQADFAGRYLVRAESLFRAAQTQPHEAVARTHWAAQQPVLAAERTRLAALQTAVPEWRAYHQAKAPQDEAHWAAERARRADRAAQTNTQLNRPDTAAKDRRVAEQARREIERSSAPTATQTGLAPTALSQSSASTRRLEALQRGREQARVQQQRHAALRAPPTVSATRGEARQRLALQAQQHEQAQALANAKAEAARAAQAHRQDQLDARRRALALRAQDQQRVTGQQRALERVQSERARAAIAQAQVKAQARAEARVQAAQARAAQVRSAEQARVKTETRQVQARAADRQAEPTAARAPVQPAQQTDQPRKKKGEQDRGG